MTSNTLNALVSSEQTCFKQTSETVCTDGRIREFQTLGLATEKARRP